MRGTRFTLAVAAALLLTGCASDASAPNTTSQPAPPSTESATHEPLEGDAALEVAVDTYVEYMTTIGTVLDQGHDDEELLDSLTTGPAQLENDRIIANAKRENWSASGVPAIRGASLVRVNSSNDTTTIVADLCVDRSNMVLLHADGTTALGEDAQMLIPGRITVEVTDDIPKVANSESEKSEIQC